MGLLGGAVEHLDLAGRAHRLGAAADLGGGRLGLGEDGGEGLLDLLDDLAVVQVAGGRDDQVLRLVAAMEEAGDLVAGEVVHRLLGAQDRPGERAGAVDDLGEEVVHDVARVVLGHRHLLKDDAALGVHVLGADQRAGEHVADHVDGERQVGVEHPRVVAGVLLRGEGVHLAADRVQGRRDVQRAAPLGALEEQVLQVVGRAVQHRGLVPGADADPDAEGRRAHRRQGLGDDSQAAGEDGTAYRAGSVGALEQGAGGAGALLRRRGLGHGVPP